MEKICRIRELLKAISQYEKGIVEAFDISLNEAIVVCLLNNQKLASTEISQLTSLTPSHTSKVLRSLEDKGLVSRMMGEKDRRQMYFMITTKGKKIIRAIDNDQIDCPEILESI